MNEVKHTKWEIKKCASCCGNPNCNYYWPGPGMFHQGTGYNKKTAELIAAAPELLETCKSAYRLLSEIVKIGANKRTQTIFLELADAISKAEGK